jgi:hypothetical protein
MPIPAPIAANPAPIAPPALAVAASKTLNKCIIDVYID